MDSALKLARFVKPYWRWAVLAPLLMLLEVTMDLMQPRMVERIVDLGVARLDLPLVIQTGLLMCGLAVIGAGGGMMILRLLAQKGFYHHLYVSQFKGQIQPEKLA